MNRELIFQAIEERRDDYLVRYTPATPGSLFASLALTFLQSQESADIGKLMHEESFTWIQRYAVPLMTSSFNDSDSLIHLEPACDCDHLFAVLENDGVTVHWKMLEGSEFPKGPLQERYLLDVYRDIPFSTLEERRSKALASANWLRRGIIIVALWGLAVPVTVALFGLANPVLGYVVIACSVSKAIYEATQTLGYVKRSEREIQKDAEALRMRHHHYHCERNPEEFLRLKLENFEREARDETCREAGA